MRQLGKAAAREDERTARQLKIQLQNDIKMSRRDKRQSFKPSLAAVPSMATQDPIEVENEVMPTSCFGRTRSRPKRLLT